MTGHHSDDDRTDGDGPSRDAHSSARHESDTHCTDGGYLAESYAHSGETARWPRLKQVYTVALTEYRLAVRSKWAFALTGLFALFGVMLATFSGSAIGPEGMERVTASLTSLAVYLVPLAALAVGYDAIVGRDQQGWLAVVFSLPVTRARVVTGTFLGRAIVLVCATIIGFGVVGFLLLREYGIAYWPTFLVFLLGAVGLGLAFLSIGLLVSTIAREKTHALGVSLLGWAWFVLVHDLLGLGLIAAMDLSETAVSALVLANPTGVYRALVLGSLGAGGDAGFASVLAESGLSSGVLVATLIAWIVLPTALAAIAIRRRRL